MKTSKALAAGVATALLCGTVGALGAPSVASAATGSTAGIHGSPINPVGTTWYDDGTVPTPPASANPAAGINLTAVQRGTGVDVTVRVSRGPDTSFAGLDAGTYRLDAFVSMDAPTKRGKRLAGTVGTTAVLANQFSYPSGTTIKGTFPNVKLGAHTFTLTDLLLDSSKFGGFGGAPAGFDAWYNKGTTQPAINAGTSPIGVTQRITVVDRVAPAVTVTKLKAKASKVKAIKGTIRDAQSGPKSVTIQAIQKRGSKWYSYNGKKWTKKASKAKAFKAAKKLTDSSVSTGAWSIKLKKVKKGKIVVRYSGADKAGNTSPVKTYSKKLK